jgi:phosphoglycerol transferase MdoB-like AlkP superfamily enzyme
MTRLGSCTPLSFWARVVFRNQALKERRVRFGRISFSEYIISGYSVVFTQQWLKKTWLSSTNWCLHIHDFGIKVCFFTCQWFLENTQLLDTLLLNMFLDITWFLQKLAAYQARVGIHRSLKGLLGETWRLSLHA